MSLSDENGKPFRFKSLKQAEMEKMVFEIKDTVDEYFPNSAANGVAGLLYAFDAILHMHIEAGILPIKIRDLFAEQIVDSGFRNLEEEQDFKPSIKPPVEPSL